MLDVAPGLDSAGPVSAFKGVGPSFEARGG